MEVFDVSSFQKVAKQAERESKLFGTVKQQKDIRRSVEDIGIVFSDREENTVTKAFAKAMLEGCVGFWTAKEAVLAMTIFAKEHYALIIDDDGELTEFGELWQSMAFAMAEYSIHGIMWAETYGND